MLKRVHDINAEEYVITNILCINMILAWLWLLSLGGEHLEGRHTWMG